MCGIFGYYNFNVKKSRAEILEFLLNGLRRLEYRGYDSAGLAIDGIDGLGKNGFVKPLLLKASGNMDLLQASIENFVTKNLDNAVFNELLQPHVGIAHTRWATHGVPSVENCHPHASGGDNEFVAVHNGIINNYSPLKEFLSSTVQLLHGYDFKSDTDTEVVVKLCKYIYDNSQLKPTFPELIMEVFKQLEGASAFLFKSSYYPGELVACRRGSPLMIGIRVNEECENDDIKLEAFVASDGAALVEHTNQYLVINDNEMYHFVNGAYKLYNYTFDDPSATIPAVLQTLEMEVAGIMKGGYDSFMQKEIYEQPLSIHQTMRGRLKQISQTVSTQDFPVQNCIILGGLHKYRSIICHGRRLILIACGTSYHACLASRQLLEELADITVLVELATDLLDRQLPLFRDDMCVFVSQSGETADILQALDYVKGFGSVCIGITNTVGSAVSRGTDCGIHINAGCEIGVASTKAYTSQIVVLTMMALYLSEDSLSKYKRRMDILNDLKRLPHVVHEVLKLDKVIKSLAESIKDENSLIVFGRGYNYATALECALKVKEVALIHSEGILAGEMKHGPLALVDEHLPIIVIATQDRMHSKMLNVMQQLLARKARLIILCNKDDPDIVKICCDNEGCRIIEVPKIIDCLQPVVNIVPLQLLSYHLTVFRGLNVDQPRNLAKSVTVSEE